MEKSNLLYQDLEAVLDEFSLFGNILLGVKVNKKKNEPTASLSNSGTGLLDKINAKIQCNIDSDHIFPVINIFKQMAFTDYEKAMAIFLIALYTDELLLENCHALYPDGFTKSSLVKFFYQSDIPILSHSNYGQDFEYCFFTHEKEIHPFLIAYAQESFDFEHTENVHNLIVYNEQATTIMEIIKQHPQTLFNIYGDKNCGKHYFAKYITNKMNKKMLTLDFDTFNIEKDNPRNIILLFTKLEHGIIYVKNLKEKDQSFFTQVADMATIIIGTHDKDEFNNGKYANFVKIQLGKLTASDKIHAWNYFNKMNQLNIDAESYGNKYVFNVGDISNIFRSAQLLSQDIGEKEILDAVKMRDGGLEGATLIDTSFSFHDLVVDDSVKRQLDHIINQLKYKNVLYDQWGFDSKLPYGRGISSLFYGPPGTGKTMTAAVIANELKLDLYKVDLSKLISKYIGETEKNITSLFDNAKNMNVILFFDEADALFAKRSDVKDSNDKNANAETAHLLQKLEEYEGITILATNLFEQLDDAFKRRIKFMIPFKLPDYQVRLQLWEKILPNNEFVDDIDVDLFARNFDLSGSQIKEIIVNACFIALSEGQKLSNVHLKEAITLNYQKYGKRLTNDDFLYLA